MNKRGNPETLVASHPGNKNAAKKGVYSPDMRTLRVLEIEGMVACKSSAHVRRDVARADLAGLVALQEALDSAIEDGIVGRGGQVKDLVRMRLRSSAAVRSAVHEYGTARAAAVDQLSTADEPSEKPDEPSEETQEPFARPEGNLLAELAQFFWADSLPQVDPVSFDADLYLKVIAETSDPNVHGTDRNRADRLLLKCRDARAEHCTCRGIMRARSEDEFATWLASLSSECKPVDKVDRYLAAVVRALAPHKELDSPRFKLQFAAVTSAIEYERRRARGEEVHEGGPAEAAEDARIESGARNDAIGRFWGIVLARDAKPAKDRLDAFEKLDRAGALRRCVCPQVKGDSSEDRSDPLFASVIRLFVRTSVMGVDARLSFPESFAALREISDQRILADRGVRLPEPQGTDKVEADGDN